MTGPAPDLRRGGLMSGVLAGAEGFFLKPVEPAGGQLPTASQATRPVIAVYGLRRGCGTSVVARALAAELAARDGARAAAVMCEARGSAIPLATPDACRLAKAFEELPGAVTRAVGRLALVDSGDPLAVAESARHLAPLVVDAGASALGGVPAALADLSIVVTVPALEPALARVALHCLERVGPGPVVVLNRGDRPGRGHMSDEDESGQPARRSGLPEHPCVLPHSRLGAQLALGGREPRGELGRAVAALADRCEAISARGGLA